MIRKLSSLLSALLNRDTDSITVSPIQLVNSLRSVGRNPGRALRNAKFLRDGPPSPARHVFVLGPPRTGTTLVKGILAAHPRFAGPDLETRFFFRRNFTDFSIREIEESVMRELVRTSGARVQLFDAIADHLLTSCSASRFLEKTPEHALLLPRLERLFPRSSFVFTVRDPRDGYLSALRNPNVKYRSARGYSEVYYDCLNARARMKRHSSLRVVKYEKLCTNPEEVVDNLMSWLGEEYLPRQLDPAAFGTSQYRSGAGHERLAQPISPATIGRWEQELCAADQAQITSRLATSMASLGYAIE